MSADAEHRGGTAGRRADGAFFTSGDVADWLARRAVFGAVLDVLDAPAWDDRALAEGASLTQLLTTAVRDAGSWQVARERLTSLVVLDPTCGAGSFLVAAWGALLEVQELLDAAEAPDGPGARRVTAAQLHGVDRDADAAGACREVLRLVTGSDDAVIVLGDALDAQLPAADVLLGNPPFVRAGAVAAPAGSTTAGVGNVAAWVVERALDAAAPGARVGFVLPVSFACTTAWEPARAHWRARCELQLASHFDTIPATLFPGVVQRISIVEGRVGVGAGAGGAHRHRAWTSRYHRWLRDERAGLLGRVRHVPLPSQTVGGSLAKIGSSVEARLLETLFAHEPAARWIDRSAGASEHGNLVHYKRRWSYFLLFTAHVPPIWDADGVERTPSEGKSLAIVPELDARVALAVWSSTLFWWYFSVFTDNRNVNVRDLAAFPVPELDQAQHDRLLALADEYLELLGANAEVRTCTYRSVGTIRNTYFRQGPTRPVLDRIDAELATAYGMTDEQLRFVLGFERRFRS